jgi:hypothetical protein
MLYGTSFRSRCSDYKWNIEVDWSVVQCLVVNSQCRLEARILQVNDVMTSTVRCVKMHNVGETCS